MRLLRRYAFRHHNVNDSIDPLPITLPDVVSFAAINVPAAYDCDTVEIDETCDTISCECVVPVDDMMSGSVPE